MLAASLAAMVGASFAPANAHAQTPGEAAAQVRFSRGREAFLAQNFAVALTEFRAANQLVPSPNTRLYIARCLAGLNRVAEAYVEFQRAAAEAADRAHSEPRFAPTRDAARAEATALESRIGRLTVHVPNAPDGATVQVNGVAVPSAAWDVPAPVEPGAVTITASAPGRRAYRQQVQVPAGQNIETTIELEVDPNASGTVARVPDRAPIDTERPPAVGDGTQGATGASGATVRRARTVGGGVRVGGFVLAGVGVVGGIGFAVFGSLTSNRYADLRMTCGFGACPAELQSQVSEGEMYQTLANVSLVLGIAGLGAGIVMIAVGGPSVVYEDVPAGSSEGATSASRRERRRERAGQGVSLWGSALPGDGGVLGVRGAF